MTRLRTLSILGAVFAVALLATPTAMAETPAGRDINASPAIEAEVTRLQFRTDFNKLLDHYDSVFQKLGNARGLRLTAEARSRMQAVTEEQLDKMFTRVPVPDLAAALRAAEDLEAHTPVVSASEPASEPGGGVEGSSAGFPGAPGILSDCNNISHSSSFTFGALVAFQVVRTILAAAEFACEEVVVVLGEGGNGAAVCIPFAIAQDVAAIPFELASFCAGEEDSAVLQGSFDRLEHIHTDLDSARTAIINNNNSNKTEIINTINANTTNILENIDANTDLIVNNDNSNRTQIINNDNSNRTQIINNDNSNRTQIINNDNTNRDVIINELRNLGCEIVRLLNTPEGQRASSVLACTGQPHYPYNFPEQP